MFCRIKQLAFSALDKPFSRERVKAARRCLCRPDTHTFEVKAAKTKAEQTPCHCCLLLAFSFWDMFSCASRKQAQETRERKQSSLRMDLGLVKWKEASLGGQLFSQGQGVGPAEELA